MEVLMCSILLLCDIETSGKINIFSIFKFGHFITHFLLNIIELATTAKAIKQIRKLPQCYNLVLLLYPFVSSMCHIIFNWAHSNTLFAHRVKTKGTTFFCRGYVQMLFYKLKMPHLSWRSWSKHDCSLLLIQCGMPKFICAFFNILYV